MTALIWFLYGVGFLSLLLAFREDFLVRVVVGVLFLGAGGIASSINRARKETK